MVLIVFVVQDFTKDYWVNAYFYEKKWSSSPKTLYMGKGWLTYWKRCWTFTMALKNWGDKSISAVSRMTQVSIHL